MVESASHGVRLLLAGAGASVAAARSALVEAGYHAEAATGGEAALRALGESPFDLVLADWRMGEMDGVELCRAIRTRPELAALHVIVLAPVDPSRPAVRALDAGVRAGELRASESRLRGLIANVPGAIYCCENDPDWTMELIGDEIERIGSSAPTPRWPASWSADSWCEGAMGASGSTA